MGIVFWVDIHAKYFGGDPPRNRSTFFVHPTEETPGRGLVHPSFLVD